MTVIDWATALTAIAGDNAAIAVTIRNKVTVIGETYDASGHPDVITESAGHISWRSDFAAQLGAIDRTAASVDGKPDTTIDPANPGASRAVVFQRLNAVLAGATGAVRDLIADMVHVTLPVEPRMWVDAYYAPNNVSISGAGVGASFSTVGDLESALLAALDELTAYVGFR